MKKKKSTRKVVSVTIDGQATQLVTPVKGKLKVSHEAFFRQFADTLEGKPLPTSKETRS